MTHSARPADIGSLEATFVFVDLAGYSIASWVHGDDLAAHLAMRLLDIATASCREGDEVVKSIGDAVMCRSSDPARALDLLSGVWRRADSEALFPQLCGGLHHGRVTTYRGDYFGTTVNVAARLASLAGSDEVFTTPAVAAAADGGRWRVEPLGERRLHNIGEPVEVVRIALRDRTVNPVDPVCHMRVDPADALTLAAEDNSIYFCSTGCRDTYLAGVVS